MSLTHRLVALSLTIFAGCAESPDAPLAAERAYVFSAGWGCPTCTFKNSAYLGLHPLDDFQLGSGAPSGYALVGIEDLAGDMHPVDFSKSALVAHTPKGDRSGTDIVDWALVFELAGAEQRVRVMGFELHPDWTGGDLVPTYALAAEVGPQGEVQLESVCPGLSFEETNVVFTPGETYDPVGVTVVPGQPDRVSLACRGHAVAKLKFLGHDPNDGYGSSVEARQAALKMLTADYCGDGTSYTTVGHPLNFEDDLGLFVPDWYTLPGAMEARWNEDGAVCLESPRNTSLARQDIACADMLPACSDKGLDGELWVSYAPLSP